MTPTAIRSSESAAGTRPARRPRGSGPPLVLVAEDAGDGAGLRRLGRWLEPHFSVRLLARRRCPVGDDGEYAIEHAFSGLAAALDALEGPVDVFAHAFGATLVLGALPLTHNIRRAVLYEPGAGVGVHRTSARERRAEERWTFGPDSYRSLTPTLLLVGTESPPHAHLATEIARSALPNSRVGLLDGQAQSALSTAPELLGRHIARFAASQP